MGDVRLADTPAIETLPGNLDLHLVCRQRRFRAGSDGQHARYDCCGDTLGPRCTGSRQTAGAIGGSDGSATWSRDAYSLPEPEQPHDLHIACVADPGDLSSMPNSGGTD